mmetsp:Transcript_56554/g.64576  ORF Transcript_56554/g.64576 Transcript_56554/m.64576 type:complete len:162 (+) Transcript_56554:91-576(+)
MASMSHWSSGRVGYNPYKPESSIIVVPSMLKLMLKEEEKRRFSQTYLEDCDRAVLAGDEEGYLKITEELQRQVAKDFGFEGDDIDLAVDAMVTAHINYPDDEVIQRISVYVRENQARMGEIKVGDEIPDVTVYGMDLQTKGISEFLMDEDKWTVLVASSLS